MSHCSFNNRVYGEEMAKSGVPDIRQESIFSVDYLLLQSAAALPRHELTAGDVVRQTRSVLFDAGTSRFDSSLFWFTCAFSQVSPCSLSCLPVCLPASSSLCLPFLLLFLAKLFCLVCQPNLCP